MTNNTISSIMKDATPINNVTKSYEDKITNMFDDMLSETLYDIDEISTRICETLMREAYPKNDVPENTGCRMIYDVFYICKSHVAKLNAEHDLMLACNASAQRSADRLNYLK